MIIGIGHKSGVGKDVAAAALCAEHHFQRIGFADALKKACAPIFGWVHWDLTQDQKAHVDVWWSEALKFDVTPGLLLQKVGVLLREHLSEDLWIKAVQKQITKYYTGCNVVIPDVRFPNEAKAIKKWGGILVRIDRPDKPKLEGRDPTHISETALSTFDRWDYVVRNEGTVRELKEKMRDILVKEGLDARRRS